MVFGFGQPFKAKEHRWCFVTVVLVVTTISDQSPIWFLTYVRLSDTTNVGVDGQIHGACDPRPIHFIETLASKLSYSTFALIPESGHYPWIEKLDEVKALIRQFIRSQVMQRNS